MLTGENWALVAPEEEIELPESASGEVDYEAELVLVIGRTARRVPSSVSSTAPTWRTSLRGALP